MTNGKNIYVATSLNQAITCEDIARTNKNDATNNILILIDASEYNEIPNTRYSDYINKESDVFCQKIYFNELISFSNLSSISTDLSLSKALSTRLDSFEANRIYVSLVSAPIYCSFIRLFDQAKVTVYSDGMMSFGPARFDFSSSDFANRIDSFYYEDLCKGVIPNYLVEIPKVQYHKIEKDYKELKKHQKRILIALQSLSYSGIFTEDEEEEFYKRYIIQICDLFEGYEIYILPHPNSAKHRLNYLNNIDRVTLLSNLYTGEEYLEKLEIEYLASCFSTLLFRAARMNVKSFTFGTDDVILNIKDLANSNRIPLFLARKCFYSYDGVTSDRTLDSLKRHISDYCVGAKDIKFILDLLSVLVKPATSNYIGEINPQTFELIDTYEKALIFSCGAYKNKPGYLAYEGINISIKNANEKIISDSKIQENIVLHKSNQDLEKKLAKANETVAKLKNSLSWKLTKPIRMVGRVFKA